MPLDRQHLISCQGEAQAEVHSHAGQAPDALLPQGDAPARHGSDQPHSCCDCLAPERPLTKSFTPDLSLLFRCSIVAFLFLLSPAPKTLAQLLWHVCTWGKESHSSLSGDVLYAAGQLSPPIAPAARAANLEKMHNMHIANSHSSSQSCAPDTTPQAALVACTTQARPLRSQLPRNERQEQRHKKQGKWLLITVSAAKMIFPLSLSSRKAQCCKGGP